MLPVKRWYNITKLSESGDLCGNITEFGVARTESYWFQTLQNPLILKQRSLSEVMTNSGQEHFLWIRIQLH